jgi:hypothetical protein
VFVDDRHRCVYQDTAEGLTRLKFSLTNCGGQ